MIRDKLNVDFTTGKNARLKPFFFFFLTRLTVNISPRQVLQSGGSESTGSRVRLSLTRQRRFSLFSKGPLQPGIKIIPSV